MVSTLFILDNNFSKISFAGANRDVSEVFSVVGKLNYSEITQRSNLVTCHLADQRLGLNPDRNGERPDR